MHFVVGGRREIERGMTIMTPYVVISISDPGSNKPRIPQTSGLCGALFLKFHDAEPIAGEILPTTIRAMQLDHARKIWKFLAEHRQSAGTVVVHCEQGMSRSPAVALAIADVLGGDAQHIEEETQPNPYVRELVRRAGESFLKTQPAGGWFMGAV